MSTRGRKPKSASVHVLNGKAVAKYSKKTTVAKGVSVSPPKPPSFLCVEAQTEWKRLAKPLWEAGLLDALSRAPFTAYCQAYGEMVIAQEFLNQARLEAGELGGMLVRTEKGNLIQHPMLSICRRAAADVVKFGSEFGITPASRERVTPLAPGAAQSKYFD